MDADQVISLIVRRRFVSENVAPHEMDHHEVLRALRDDWVSSKLYCNLSRDSHLGINLSNELLDK